MVREGSAAVEALTISALARQFGLSRSTLLHYHRIHLFKPTGRSASGYRFKRVLDARTPLADVLEEQISLLNRQVADLRKQQRVVLSLLELSSRQTGRGAKRTLSKETWTEMFRAIGMSDDEMRRWHANFEKNMPDAHVGFLHSLGLGPDEIQRIRAWSTG